MENKPVRKLIASAFVSIEGIMQAPGGPEEDPTGNFSLGGWMFHFADESMDLSASGFDGKNRELVLGRRLFDDMCTYWPTADEDPEASDYIREFAGIWRNKPKYIISGTIK